jgi:hypothetical protein
MTFQSRMTELSPKLLYYTPKGGRIYSKPDMQNATSLCKKDYLRYFGSSSE